MRAQSSLKEKENEREKWDKPFLHNFVKQFWVHLWSIFHKKLQRVTVSSTNVRAIPLCPALDKYMLSPKLRCYTGIFGLRKAVTTHVKKDRIFSTCVDIANQLLTRHSPLAPLGQVDEWTAKPSRFSIQGRLSELSQIVAVKTLKNPYRWQTVRFKLF